jgi:hypothetical protein
MVLGVQWLGTLGPILWDFAWCTLEFQRGGKHILWRRAEAMPRLAAAPLSTPGADLLDALLEEFRGLFVPPQGLPPRRHLDHHIRL